MTNPNLPNPFDETKPLVFSEPINWNNSKWEVGNPMILDKVKEINIESGFYKINYYLNKKGVVAHGLAIFEKDSKKFRDIIVWNSADQSIQVKGEQFIEIKTPGIIAITGHSGEFKPKGFSGFYILSLHKLVRRPDIA